MKRESIPIIDATVKSDSSFSFKASFGLNHGMWESTLIIGDEISIVITKLLVCHYIYV